ncbi:hypothetical protein AVEN_46009-1 [Araneus ventricosus]|uniref:Uncharacterized protein n=1 Tax=Araneus ventricosus TaxID=182803 RepID=A0A4Y2F4S1_ARAVE|nr:hypothetical protein AVEN_46009-1 [Araneus ventricosus]
MAEDTPTSKIMENYLACWYQVFRKTRSTGNRNNTGALVQINNANRQQITKNDSNSTFNNAQPVANPGGAMGLQPLPETLYRPAPIFRATELFRSNESSFTKRKRSEETWAPFAENVVMFPSREQRSHEKKSAVPFHIGGKQQDSYIWSSLTRRAQRNGFTQRAATMPRNKSLSANTLAVPFGVIPE